MSFLVCMPYTYEPYRGECMRSMAPEFREHVMTINNTGENNRGVAASWNIGARSVVGNGTDWLISLSPATRFGPSGGLDLVEHLESLSTPWVVESSAPVGWHCIAWHRDLFERVGFFDENFWPAYGEDADISHRFALASESESVARWARFDLDGWITMQGHSAHLAGIRHPQNWGYYQRKWGGLSGHERFTLPFGDKPLDWWKKKQ